MYQREALWIAFSAPDWHPHAVKVGVGAVDAVGGGPWGLTLGADPQDYLVVPDQPWLDGINAGAGVVRQFVAAPLGRGVTVEAQVAGREDGGLCLAVIPPMPGRFPDAPPPPPFDENAWMEAPMCCAAPPLEYGVGAGGRMQQKLYPDEHGLDAWDAARAAEVRVRIVNSARWAEITGEAPPPSPVTAAAYREFGLPWFALYDEDRRTLARPDALAGVRSMDELEGRAGVRPDGTAPPDLPVVTLPTH
jgi:hypothetical protein